MNQITQEKLEAAKNDFTQDLMQMLRNFNDETGLYVEEISLGTELTPNANGSAQVYSIFPPVITFHPMPAKKPAKQKKAEQPLPPGDE